MAFIISSAFLLLAVFGTLQVIAGLFAVWAFARAQNPAPVRRPAVTIMKPVCGNEPLLEEAIRSFCEQDYPHFQLLIGARDAEDPALVVARRLQRRFPRCDIGIVIDSRLHGQNRKISNLMNMLSAAKHKVLVIADSDLHVRPDYLSQIVAALQTPGTGLVTTVCSGGATVPGFAAKLGATHISHTFLTGALVAVAVGRQDCLGGTMALTRETLERVNGLEALVAHLADDNILGQNVLKLGLQVKLAATVPVMAVPERSLRAVWQHELRWARTIRALAPIAYGASIIQFPLFWASLAVLASGGGWLDIGGFLVAWLIRYGVAREIDRSLSRMRGRRVAPTPAWLLPVRDILSAVEIVASFCGNAVVWRGHAMRSDHGRRHHAPALHLPSAPPAYAHAARELDVMTS